MTQRRVIASTEAAPAREVDDLLDLDAALAEMGIIGASDLEEALNFSDEEYEPTHNSTFGGIIDDHAIVDELDLGAYPVIPAGGTTDSVHWTEQFLIAVKKDFDEKGIGIFDSILQFPHSRVNDEDVNRFQKAVSARISRIRAAAGGAARNFRVAFIQHEILADNKHVAFRAARMTEAKFWVHMRQRWDSKRKVSPTQRLKDLI